MADGEEERELAAFALSGEVDQFVLSKAAARASLALVINTMLNRWKDEPSERREKLQDALIAALSDLTAECAVGMKAPTKEQFLHFMELAYNQAVKDDPP